MKCSMHVRAENVVPNGVLLSDIAIILKDLGLCPESFTWTMHLGTRVGLLWFRLPVTNEDELAKLYDRLLATRGVASIEENGRSGKFGMTQKAQDQFGFRDDSDCS
jgi:hypothetical protein